MLLLRLPGVASCERIVLRGVLWCVLWNFQHITHLSRLPFQQAYTRNSRVAVLLSPWLEENGINVAYDALHLVN